jgi:uncharacterized protein YciI
MNDDHDRLHAVVPSHVAHWHALELHDYRGGPFGDRSGGLITFTAEDSEEAQRSVDSDPFVREGLLREQWLN